MQSDAPSTGLDLTCTGDQPYSPLAYHYSSSLFIYILFQMGTHLDVVYCPNNLKQKKYEMQMPMNVTSR